MKKELYILFAISLCLSGCHHIRDHQSKGVVAEINGQKLYEAEVNTIIGNRTGEDSARVRREYIHQWVIDILVQHKANEYISPEIERLVADYRRSLCAYEYEKELVSHRMSKHIDDSILTTFYQKHQNRLILQDDIFKGVLLVIPKDAPNQDALMRSLRDLKEDDLQFLEKYAYQNATGYELFLDQWKTANQLLVRMPFERNTLVSELRNKQQIVLQDSLSKYILQVTQKELEGNQMPFDYARPEIEKIILSERQKEFLKKEHENLYQEGLRTQKIKIYE